MEVALREKGRITIPASIRKAMGLREGDKLSIEAQLGVLILKPAHHVTADELWGILGVHHVDIEETETALGEE